MQLREGEKVLKVYHHHPTPFVFTMTKAVLYFVPFFALLYFFQEALSRMVQFWAIVVLLIIFSLLTIYLALIYWLDKMVVTDQRIVYIDWKYLTVKKESEAMLHDIQEIRTHEKGILSHFWIFDYGDFILKTASSKITIVFDEAPNPEEIRRYVYHLRQQ